MQDKVQIISGIHLGDRKKKFKKLIVSLLNKGEIKQKYIDLLTDKDSLSVYSDAFTSELVNEEHNYQVYEQMGDLSGNKFIVTYCYERFPQLRCAEGVKVVARLRINYGSKQSFATIAEKYNFWDFITATNELRQRKKKSLLEDVFEAFLGATEFLLDSKTRIGVGYACIYKILKAIFDDMPISLRYEDLYDAKTRLKELFDIYAEQIGPLVYEEKRDELITHSSVFRLEGAKYAVRPDGTLNTNSYTGRYKKVLIGQGSAALKADAEQKAAAEALKNLTTQGYIKYAPRIYAKFSGQKEIKDVTKQVNDQTKQEDVLKIISTLSQINEQFPTRGKSKHQTKYTSPVLLHYCRKKDYDGIKICLAMKADVTLLDSEGMSALDLLLLNSDLENQTITKAFKRLAKRGKLPVHQNIFEVFGNPEWQDKVELI